MKRIVASYRRMAKETNRPCYSVTFWQTVDGNWGARAGLGAHQFAADLDIAVALAVDSAIIEQAKRSTTTVKAGD